jgi:protein-tyrosine phosphatase
VIDTHCHLLPGLDDGAPDDAVALAMARAAVADGVTAITATPHMREGDYLNERPTVLEAVDRFRELLAREAVPLAVEPGSEVHLSARLAARLAERRILTYADRVPSEGRPAYLLLECPYRTRPIRLDETVFELLLAGIVPVIAHPERIRWFQEDPERYEALVTRGVLGQMTTSSLLGTFGGRVQLLAETFVRRGLVHVLASDAHDTEYRPPRLAAARHRWAELAGEASAEAATVGIPRALVEGRPVEVAPPRPEPKPRGLWERLRGGR